jgi:sigma-B regulation protein RsbU (phosphoserine phosphatase)
MRNIEDPLDIEPCVYLSLWPDGRIAKIDDALSEWLFRSQEDLFGRKIGDLLSFGGRIAFETHLTPMLRLNGEVSEITLDLETAHGEKLPVIASARENRDKEGRLLFTHITMFKASSPLLCPRSLAARKDEARNITKAAEETGHLQKQFIAVLGQDLRNPLAALAAGAGILSREVLSSRGEFVLREMERSIARANLLIEQVLDFARGRFGEGLILDRNDDAPLTPVLKRVITEVQDAVPEREIRTRLEICEPIDCDRLRLGQLAANLLSNAITHGDPTQPIEVAAYSKSGRFTFSVTNGGPPIPENERLKLFQPFFCREVRDGQQGLGLGLFIVDQIATAHDGVMSVQSDDTQTCFSFSMPEMSASAF